MKKRMFNLLVIGFAFFLTTCGEKMPLSPEVSIEKNQLLELAKSSNSVTVMTRNIYIGADVDVVLGAQSLAEVPILAAQAFQEMISTRFPERAQALAKEVFETRPDIIGLQEVSIIRRQFPGDAVVGGTSPAKHVLFDYLRIFRRALKTYGLRYDVAGKIQNVDIELPMIVSQNPLAFADIRVTDYDVILVKRGVKVSNVVEKNFQVTLPIETMGIEIPRGFVAINATVNGRTYRFANTHIEPFSQIVKLAQTQEFLSYFQNETLPLIMVGDFNTPATHGPAYNMIVGQNYLDVWTQNLQPSPSNPNGYTNPHDSDLRNTNIKLDQRIDIIFAKNANGSQNIGPVYAEVTGDELDDRTATGLWPSDHAGVVATLNMPTAPVFAKK